MSCRTDFLAGGQKIESRWEKVELASPRVSQKRLTQWTIDFLFSTRSTFYCSTFFFRGRQMTFQFEKLLVYQKSVDFADAVCTASEQFQRGASHLPPLQRSGLASPTAVCGRNLPIAYTPHVPKPSPAACDPVVQLPSALRLVSAVRHTPTAADLELPTSRQLRSLIVLT